MPASSSIKSVSCNIVKFVGITNFYQILIKISFWNLMKYWGFLSVNLLLVQTGSFSDISKYEFIGYFIVRLSVSCN